MVDKPPQGRPVSLRRISELEAQALIRSSKYLLYPPHQRYARSSIRRHPSLLAIEELLRGVARYCQMLVGICNL
jgi:hypothetical protein